MQQVPVDSTTLRALNARFTHFFVTKDVESREANTHPRFLNIAIAIAGRRAELHEGPYRHLCFEACEQWFKWPDGQVRVP